MYVVQRKTALCRRFTLFVTRYSLIPLDNLIVPAEDLEAFNNPDPSESLPVADEALPGEENAHV